MANFPSDHMTARSRRDAWMHDNERGLALAADGDWAEASEAFAAAADTLARTLPSESRGSHEPLALVLSNLAQAYFRSGRVDDAMLQAQRACALRVAIAGEDGMPVARARMDLAVMLASAGRLDEATMLVQRSISAIEHRVGEEDARLAIVLENAARIALAAGQPANAEPLLIRLHALLDVHELSTSRAEALLTRVAAARAGQQATQKAAHAASQALADEAMAAPALAAVSSDAGTEALEADDVGADVHEAEAGDIEARDAHAEERTEERSAVRSETPEALSAFDDDAAARIYAHASIAEHEEWEDQPLRDAVAVTDVLLRTTPSGVPVIPAAPVLEPPTLDDSAIVLEEADALLDTMDLTDVLPAPSLREPDAGEMLSLEPTPAGGVEFDLDLAFDEPGVTDASSLDGLDMVDFAPTEPLAPSADAPSTEARLAEAPRAEEPPSPVPFPTSSGRLTLDFGVEHGMIDDEDLIQGPPVSTPVPDALEAAPLTPSAPTIVPVTQVVSAGPTNGIAPIADIVQTAPVMDGPSAANAAPTSPTPPQAAASRASGATGARSARRSSDEGAVLPKPEPSGGKGKLIAIIAGVVAVGGGAAAFFLLR